MAHVANKEEIMQAQLTWSVMTALTVLGQSAQAPDVPVRLDLQDKLLTQNPVVRDISDMRIMEGQGSKRHLLVAGTCGVFSIDTETGEVLQEAAFDLDCPPFLSSMIVDAEGDGHVELARFSSGWVDPTAIIELNGTTRWSRETPARCQRPLDLDADGKIEILVGQPNSRMVQLLDHKGEVVWEREWASTNAEGLPWDIDGDGAMELLYVDGKALHVCDRDGRDLFAETPPGGGYVNAIELIKVPEALGGAYILVGAYAGKRQVFHAYDRGVKKHLSMHRWEEVAPFVDSQWIKREDGDLLIKIENQKKQAFPAGYESSELLLSVSDIQGRRVFEKRVSKPNKEVAVTESVLVLDEDPLRFIVGYGDRVWEYTEL